MALGTVPGLLFLLALLPRVWAPDLVPYGPIQAALIADAASRAGTSWLHVYADPAFPVAALVDPLLRDLPAPVGAWIVLRALLDSFGVAILYLAIGRVLNRGAALLAASIYALDPALWATTRDPAGSLAGLIVAAGLLAAVRAIRRPTPINGIVLGLALALLVRHFPPGWGFVLAGALTLALARASWITGSVTALAMLAGAGPAIWARPFAVVPGLASVADGWRPVLGSFAWLPSESALPGTVALDSLIGPAAVLALVLALSGTIHALIYAWKTPPSVLVLPIWALLTTLSMAWLALPGAGNAATAAAIVPVLAGLVVVPIAVSTWTSLRWATGLAIVLLLGIGTVTFALNLVGIERASHERAGFGAARLAADTPGSGPIAVRSQLGLHEVPTEQRSLRTWQALADTIQATSERTGATDVVSLADDDRLVPLLASLLRGSPAVRRLPPGVSVLPLTRETVVRTPGLGWPHCGPGRPPIGWLAPCPSRVFASRMAAPSSASWPIEAGRAV